MSTDDIHAKAQERPGSLPLASLVDSFLLVILSSPTETFRRGRGGQKCLQQAPKPESAHCYRPCGRVALERQRMLLSQKWVTTWRGPGPEGSGERADCVDRIDRAASGGEMNEAGSILEAISVYWRPVTDVAEEVGLLAWECPASRSQKLARAVWSLWLGISGSQGTQGGVRRRQ